MLPLLCGVWEFKHWKVGLQDFLEDWDSNFLVPTVPIPTKNSNFSEFWALAEFRSLCKNNTEIWAQSFLELSEKDLLEAKLG